MRNNIGERMPGISAANVQLTLHHEHKKTPTNAEVLSIRNVIPNSRLPIRLGIPFRLDDGNHYHYYFGTSS
jgi:hypothetical protein